MIAERARRDHDETTAPEPQSGLQGEGGLGRHQGREDAGRVSAAVRRASQPDRAVAYAAARRRIGHFRRGGEGRSGSGRGREDAAREDRGADARERFFIWCARQGRSVGERKAMIDRTHRLGVGRQAKALGISRGSVYYLPRPTPDADLALMRRIDELHLDYPFAGGRMLQGLLRAEGHEVGRLHVSTLMKKMGIEALYRRPKTSKPAPGHKVYPYLLRNMAVTRPNQVWAMDITYVPMARGFVYLAAIVDWFSRKVLAWRLSITLSADFCIEALEEALARHGRPDVFNTDQGSQGGLNRSSQRLDIGGCDGYRKAAFGSVWARAPSVAGPAVGDTARGSGTVLGGHRGKALERGRRGRRRENA